MDKVSLLVLSIIITVSSTHVPCPLEEVCSFNKLVYRDFQDNSCVPCGEFASYLPAANVPRRFEKVGSRMFIATPRRFGVPCTLSVFDMSEIVDKKCPILKCYPSIELNQFSEGKCGDYVRGLVNVGGLSADQCKFDQKLWVLDMGALSETQVVKKPALAIISLKNDQILRYRVLPKELYSSKNAYGFTNVVVNVVSEDCNDAYAYILNSVECTLTVYSYKEDKFWQFFSTLFVLNAYPDSLFEVKTLNDTVVKYQLDASIWDVSVSSCKKELLFGARASKFHFKMPLDIVHNRTAADTLRREEYGITFLGQYQQGGQVASFHLIPEYQTVFGIQEQKYNVFCWNYQNKLTPEAVKVVAGGRDLVPFLVDSRVDRCNHDIELYVLSNNLPGIAFDDFYDIKNFRLFKINVRQALLANPECTSHHFVHYNHPKCECDACKRQMIHPQYVPYPMNYVPVYVPEPAPCPHKKLPPSQTYETYVQSEQKPYKHYM